MTDETPELALAEAVRYHRAGNLGQAQASCRRLLCSHPGNPDALHLWGLCHVESGRHQQGADLISRALLHNPGSAVYHNSLAECHQALGQSELAIQHCQEAIRLDPTYSQPHANLALLYQQLDRAEQADQHRAQALALESKYGSTGSSSDVVLPSRAAGRRAKQLAAPKNAVAASQRAASLIATRTLGTIGGSGEPIETITGSGGANVLAVEHVRLATDQVLVLEGKSSDVFIINVAGDFLLADRARIQLAGELAPNQVLWNLPAPRQRGQVQLAGTALEAAAQKLAKTGQVLFAQTVPKGAAHKLEKEPGKRGQVQIAGTALTGAAANLDQSPFSISRVVRGGAGSILYGTLLAPFDNVEWHGAIHGGLIVGGTTTGEPVVQIIPFASVPEAPPTADTQTATQTPEADTDFVNAVDELMRDIGFVFDDWM